ncbi:MAG: PfkB family carbohydrate kinase [Nitrospirota bacterium]
MNPLEGLIHQWKGKRVVVLADIVADVFLYGEISRISREAPVLILNHKDSKQVPGGGANAIHNIWALGGNPYPVGIVGDDSEGERMLDQFAEMNIDVSGIEKVSGYKTPTKMRVIAQMPHGYRQQVVRLDWGASLSDASVLDRAKKRLKKSLGNADALMISDYGYGMVFPEMLSGIGKVKVPTTVDSRFSVQKFTGMTAAAPNESEVEAALGIKINNDTDKLNKAGQAFRKQLNHDALLITRGRDGMALFERGKKPVHIPIHGSDEVADVTGAGDTVMAAFTLALSAGGSFYEAAQLANMAGGIVVMKYGTCTVSPEELLAAVHTTKK